jgi:predicted pyridoxine 5'-phosphate oxidase superfamily flavin-nucleotide-binding protein
MRAAGAVTYPISDDGGATTAAPSPQREPMPVEARELVPYVGLAYVATTRPDGQPNMSPKGTLKVIDGRTLAFAELASPQTLENLRRSRMSTSTSWTPSAASVGAFADAQRSMTAPT